MQQGLAVFQPAAILSRDAEGPSESTSGKPGHMRRQHDIGQRKQWVRGVRRLSGKDIQPRRSKMAGP